MAAPIWITSEINSLPKTSPTERLLLARICFRAAIDPKGACRDTNKELATAVNVTPEHVSACIKSLKEKNRLTYVTEDERFSIRALYPLKNFLTPYVNSLPGQENQEGGARNSEGGGKEIPGGGIRNSLPPYKEEKEGNNSSKESEEERAEERNADATAEPDNSTLPANGEAPTPPVPAAPPAPTKPEKQLFGDQVLQRTVNQFARDNPKKYTNEMYTAFLFHFTAIVQNDPNPDYIGLEKWRAQNTWSLPGRLHSWHTVELKKLEEQKHEQSSRNAKNGHTGAGNSSRPKNGNSRPSKRTPYITPNHLRRDGPATGDEGSGSDGRTVILDVE